MPFGERTLWDLLDEEDEAERRGRRRFALEGPFNLGDPVHETLTRAALAAAGILPNETKFTDPAAWEYVRGVFWNDDPLGQLFDDGGARTDDFSSGFEWLRDFRRAEREARQRFHGPDASLLARSHFGDMQFLHAMASKDGVAAADTREEVLDWLEFAHGVATGAIPGTARLDALPVDRVRARLADLKDESVSGLFGCRRAGDVRRRALGSMLHVLQDSFAAGHVDREVAGGKRGNIAAFLSYAGQDHDRHAKDDGWRGGATEEERIRRVKGAFEAIAHGAELARQTVAGTAWAEIRASLTRTTFALVDQPRPSGPGGFAPK